MLSTSPEQQVLADLGDGAGRRRSTARSSRRRGAPRRRARSARCPASRQRSASRSTPPCQPRRPPSTRMTTTRAPSSTWSRNGSRSRVPCGFAQRTSGKSSGQPAHGRRGGEDLGVGGRDEPQHGARSSSRSGRSVGTPRSISARQPVGVEVVLDQVAEARRAGARARRRSWSVAGTNVEPAAGGDPAQQRAAGVVVLQQAVPARCRACAGARSPRRRSISGAPPCAVGPPVADLVAGRRRRSSALWPLTLRSTLSGVERRRAPAAGRGRRPAPAPDSTSSAIVSPSIW